MRYGHLSRWLSDFAMGILESIAYTHNYIINLFIFILFINLLLVLLGISNEK